jgi:hypothetical protein
MNLALRLQHDAALAAQAADAPTPAQPPATPEEPQSRIACQATTQDGAPCRARVIDGATYCPFHHPDHAEAVAAGRRRGGSAPYHRARRLPAVLDHMHVAEFMSELLVDAMNDPDRADLRRLAALTSLSRVLLRAVGAPRRGFLFHADRVQTPAHVPHHVRLYPAPDPERQALLAALEELPAPEEAPSPRESAAAPPEAILLAPDSTLLPPVAPGTGTNDPVTIFYGDPELLSWSDMFDAWRSGRDGVCWETYKDANRKRKPWEDVPVGSHPPTPPSGWEAAYAPASRQAREWRGKQAEKQAPEQVMNSNSTGHPANEENCAEVAAAPTGRPPQPAVNHAARPHTREESLPECGLQPAPAPRPTSGQAAAPAPTGSDPCDSTTTQAPDPPVRRGLLFPRPDLHASWPPKLPPFPW